MKDGSSLFCAANDQYDDDDLFLANSKIHWLFYCKLKLSFKKLLLLSRVGNIYTHNLSLIDKENFLSLLGIRLQLEVRMQKVLYTSFYNFSIVKPQNVTLRVIGSDVAVKPRIMQLK